MFANDLHELFSHFVSFVSVPSLHLSTAEHACIRTLFLSSPGASLSLLLSIVEKKEFWTAPRALPPVDLSLNCPPPCPSSSTLPLWSFPFLNAVCSSHTQLMSYPAGSATSFSHHQKQVEDCLCVCLSIWGSAYCGSCCFGSIKSHVGLNCPILVPLS